MNESKEIIITIKGAPQPSSPGGQPGVPATPQNVKPEENAKESAAESQQALTTVVVQLAERALSQVVNMAVGTADYYITRSLVLKDDYAGQRDYQIIKSVIGGVASDVGSVAGWTVAGFKMGQAPGAVVGLVLGTAVTALSRGLDYAKQMQQQELQIRLLNQTLEFNRQRAGYSLSSGSVGEDR